jgi:MFS transporter, PPP family, 3-phenylpropionic acid transporter
LLGAYYFTYLGAIGVFLPFVSLVLSAAGLPAAEVTQVMALGPLAGLLVPPLVGLVADWRSARVWLLRVGTLLTALVSFGFATQAPPRWRLVATMAAFSFFRAPLLSLADAVALDLTARSGGHYGRVRLWGSLGFLVAALGGGRLYDRVGAAHMMLLCSALLALAVAGSFALPPLSPAMPTHSPAPAEARQRVLAEWQKMLARPALWLFLAAAFLWYAASSTYDGAFSLHLKRLGFDGRFVGIAWAVGVAAEVALLAVSGPILARLGAARLFALGTATAVVRWLCLGQVKSAAAILVLQPLHGITFGLTYVAGVHLASERGGRAPAAAQGLFAMATMSGSLAGMSIAGALLDRWGGPGLFTVASAVALGGAGCALAYADVSSRR